jgi:tetratricopeptide (TPR) repeat protein
VLRDNDRPTAARAKALNGAAVMALSLGDTATAKLRAEEALAIHRRVQDAWGIAYSTMIVGGATAEGRDLAGAKPVLEESIRLFDELGDEHYALLATWNLAWVAGDLGDGEAERQLNEDILRRARATGQERMESAALAQLAMSRRDEGRLEDAESMIRRAIGIEHNRGNVLDVALDVGRLASVLARTDRAEVAIRLLSSSEALIEGLGASSPFWAEKRNEETLAIIREQIDETAFAEAWEEGQKLTVDEAVELALSDA